MIAPVRIQRSRQHKQVSPNGLPIVYVGRPTIYGNPFRVNEKQSAQECVNRYEEVVTKHNLWTKPNVAQIKESLKGKNLSCWCRIGEPCHADVLLKIANQ